MKYRAEDALLENGASLMKIPGDIDTVVIGNLNQDVLAVSLIG
jgi:hypothetical protein